MPAGIISLGEAYAIAFIGFAIYIISAFFINLTAFLFSPIPAVVAYIYPYLKRFTCLSHYFLGLNLALAPMGGWVAVRDSINFDSEILIFSISVIFWVSGFDIIYASKILNSTENLDFTPLEPTSAKGLQSGSQE